MAAFSTAVIGTVIAVAGSYVSGQLAGEELWPVFVMIPVGAITGRFSALTIHNRMQQRDADTEVTRGVLS